MKYAYPATLSPEPDGRYSIWFEDLPGCATSGESIADAIDAAEDALAGWLYGSLKHGDAIPAPSALDAVPLQSGQSASYVAADLDAYRRTVESFAVKKTLTIPSWLNEKAETAGVNFSQTLQDALIARLGD